MEKIVLSGPKLRGLFLRLKRAGGIVYADVINYKRICTEDKTAILNAVKVGSEWKCEIHSSIINLIKK